MNNNNLKLAIQKEGRLTESTLDFLRRSGLEFESIRPRLFSTCRNFPLEILYVRDNDIPGFIAGGVVDVGILGQNLLYERQPKVKKLLNLRFGFCSLVLAVPKESNVKTVSDLKGKVVATTYPQSTKNYFDEVGIETSVVQISGSVEITPALGVSDAVSDLISTGSTLALNDLRVLTKIYDSEAVLVVNRETNNSKNILLERLLTRFQGVLSAKNYKYILMNAPEEIIPRLKKIIPGFKFLTLSRLSKAGWISVQAVVREDAFWETIEKIKKVGASGIVVLPIEKMII
jgi:ATP phosphoribosyltransferase